MSRHWPRVRLGEVLRRSEEAAVLQADTEYSEITVRLWGKGVVERGRVLGAEITGNKRFVAREGQFIASRIDARNGAMGIVPSHLDGAVVTNDFPLFNINAGRLLPAYFRWLSGTRGFVELCLLASEGTTNRVRLKEDRFLALEIPLPPLTEQRRIVARIEELAAQIHEARALREQASAEAELVQYAAMRRLRFTLLKRNFPKVPIGEITTVTSGGTPSRDNPNYWNGNIPWIKTGELIDGDVLSAEEHITDAGVANSSAKIFPPHTVLIALYGQGQTRGRTGRLLIPAATNQACCAILPNEEKLDPRFVQYWLRGLYFELREQAQGGAQPNWNSGMIKALIIPLAPISEQRRIVAELDTLQAEVDTLKRHQRDTAAELDALLPAILDRAFRGEL